LIDSWLRREPSVTFALQVLQWTDILSDGPARTLSGVNDPTDTFARVTTVVLTVAHQSLATELAYHLFDQ